LVSGKPIADASLDVWSDNHGATMTQQLDIQLPFNNRGIFRTGGRSVLPAASGRFLSHSA
jgi:hypothetical protein